MKQLQLLLLFAVLIVSCRDQYELPLRETDLSLLVVEGVLNAGAGPTTITLSRTVKVNAPTAFKAELGAKLTVEGKNGASFPLAEIGNGVYRSQQLTLVFGNEYRLRIRTSNNKEYLSDYVVVKQTPPIDSLTWKKENERMVILANTHDASNNTRYYKWEFDETWEIKSYYNSSYKWIGGTTIILSSDQNYTCWKYAKPNTILLGSSAQLQSDVISQAPIQFIPFFSEKLSVRYSMLLRQRAITKEAYEFFSLMKKNTESLGSIFDPQPSELKGNIKCLTHPQEGVIGYLTASNFTEKRIFITAQEANWKFNEDCPAEKVFNNPAQIASKVPNYLPYDYDDMEGVYYMAPAACIDCTKRGGDLNKPSYW